MSFSTNEKVSLLLKKNLGKPSTNDTIQFYSEPAIDARPKVFTTQIFADSIPTTRPSSGWTDSSNNAVTLSHPFTAAGDFSQGVTATNGILKYYHQWEMEKVTPGNNMSYKAKDDNGVNPLQGSVPFNYDNAGGYGVLLYRKTSGSPGAQISDGVGEWVVDPDAGVLTFYEYSDVSSYVDESTPPYLSFYRYIGDTGLTSVSHWVPYTDGIYYNQSNKTVLIGKQTRTNNTFDLEVERDAKFSGSVYAQQVVCSSDRNLKKNIRTVRRPLSKLTGLRGVSFRWKANNEQSYGVLADEIESQLPGSAHKSGSGYMAVNYNAAIALLIESVKAQAGQIDTLKRKLASIERKLKSGM